MSAAARANADADPDFLDEDREIPSQRFVLLSFISPENVLDKKEHFFFDRFLKNYEVEWKTKNLENFLASTFNSYNERLGKEADKLYNAGLQEQGDLVLAARLQVADALTMYGDFVKKNAAEINKSKIKEDYENFMYKNREKLEDEFYAANKFQTSVRGLKVRGAYPTAEEAGARAKKLQKEDPLHNIFMAAVGKWIPWDPSPSQIKEQEYANDELNKLMKSYNENQEKREEFYGRNPHLRNTGAFREGGPAALMGTESSASTGGASAATGIGSSTSAGGSMFDEVGDLVLQRKMAQAQAAKKNASGDGF
jgi:hypothetical protein